MAPGSTVIHTYGVVDGVPSGLPDGIGGSPTTTLELGPVTLVVGQLDAERFGPEAWEQHGQDPRWLEPVARQHHEVLQALCDADDALAVVPLRLPGIYTDEEALRAALLTQADDLRRALDEVRGHSEWGVKVFLTGAAETVEQPAPTSGRDYLQRRSAAVRDRDQLRERRHRIVLDVHEGLASVATHSVTNPPQDEALTGRKEPMLLNGAYLVPDLAQDQFFGLAEELHHQVAAEGMVIEVSGPWPPYNFARLTGAQAVS